MNLAHNFYDLGPSLLVRFTRNYKLYETKEN